MNWKAFFLSLTKPFVFGIVAGFVIICLVFFIADLYFGLIPGALSYEYKDINDSTYMKIRTKHYVNCLGDTMRVKTDTLFRHRRSGVALADIPSWYIRTKKEVIGDTTRFTIDSIQTNYGEMLLITMCQMLMEIPSDSIRVWRNDSIHNSELLELIQTVEDCSKETTNPIADSALRHLQGLD